MSTFQVTDTFEINGTNYRQKAMDPLVAAQLWPKIAGLIAPALGALSAGDEEENRAEVLSKALSEAFTSLERDITKLIAAFEPCSQVEYVAPAIPGAPPSAATWLPVRTGRDFVRKHLDLVEWLVTCIKNEFADFLSATGLSRLEGMVSRFVSPTG